MNPFMAFPIALIIFIIVLAIPLIIAHHLNKREMAKKKTCTITTWHLKPDGSIGWRREE